MSEYHLVKADGSGTIASFDGWGEHVRKAWAAAAKRGAVNLICMWPCGCLYRGLARERTLRPVARFVNGEIQRGRKKTVRIHTGWRRVEACAHHAKKKPKKNEVNP